MQLTWLLGAPNRPASVHQRVVGRCGLGSSATQLMRAVRLPPPGGEAELMYRKCRRGLVAGESGRSERSAGQVVVGLRAGCSVEVHAAAGLARKRALGQQRGALIWRVVHRGPADV